MGLGASWREGGDREGQVSWGTEPATWPQDTLLSCLTPSRGASASPPEQTTEVRPLLRRICAELPALLPPFAFPNDDG